MPHLLGWGNMVLRFPPDILTWKLPKIVWVFKNMLLPLLPMASHDLSNSCFHRAVTSGQIVDKLKAEIKELGSGIRSIS